MTTFQTSGPIAAEIEIGSGDIKVSASDRTDCIVTVEPRDQGRQADLQAAAEALVELTNGVLLVKSAKTWHRFTGPNKHTGSLVVTVELPTGSALTATTGMGFVHAEGELADASIMTGLGDIRLDRVGALTAKSGLGDIAVDGVALDARVKTGSGSVRLGAVGGAARVRNANGTIEVAECGRDLDIRTASGDIAVDRALASVTAASAAGAIRISEVSAGSIVVRSGAGAIQIGIRQGTAAWVEATSKYGSVRNGLTVSSGPAESESTVEVRAHTGGGDITISRAVAA